MQQSKAIQQLDLNLLKVFESLYQERNMTQTAKVLFITPSAVSHAIKRLRAILKDPLFIRQGSFMQPTPACQRMAPQLLESLTRIRQILQQCGEFDLATTTQTFTLAVHHALEALVVPPLLTSFSTLAPDASFASVKLARETMSQQLSSGITDIAIDVALPIKSPIHHYRLSSDPFCILMHVDNPLVNHLNKDSYQQAQHIAVSNRPLGRVIEDIALQQQGINRKINIRCQNYHTAKSVLTNSSAILTLPSFLANQIADSSLTICPLPIEIAELETRLYWHNNTDKDDAMIWFRQQVKALFTDMEHH